MAAAMCFAVLDFDPGELITASISLAAAQTIMSGFKGLCSGCNALMAFLTNNKVAMPTKPTAGEVLGDIPSEFWTDAQRDNKDFMLAAVTRKADAFCFASKRLQEDAEVRANAGRRPLAAPRGSRPADMVIGAQAVDVS
jgi:hypothetical protein